MTQYMLANGQSPENLTTLGYFGSTGFQTLDRSPKPALEVWDSFRKGK